MQGRMREVAAQGKAEVLLSMERVLWVHPQPL